MPTNPYFHITPREADEVEKLIIESIQAKGVDVVYIPRTLVKNDYLFGEDTIAKFEQTYLIEMYIDNYNGWKGEGDFLTKFGLEIQQGLDFIVSIKQFEALICRKAQILAPQSGDLIYIPFMKKLFEVKRPTKDSAGMPFHQLQRNNVYKLNTQLFIYSHEDMNTGAPSLDRVQSNVQDAIYLMGVTGGSEDFFAGETLDYGLTACATIVGWNDTTSQLLISGVSGDFVVGETVEGSMSEAEWEVVSITSTTKIRDKSGYGENEKIELEEKSNEIIDFTRQDPFSEGSY